ncbi:MAG: arginine--tRNA ligase [Euryarchaeota archaeon]|nr:arginine--tRNA ligase [Euryarchaeota archaeon]
MPAENTRHPLAAFEAEAGSRLRDALEAHAPGTEPRFVHGVPPEGQGEFAAGCFPLAKTLSAKPADIATTLAERVAKGLEGATDSWVAGVAAMGPYVNFRIDVPRLIAATLQATHTHGDAYGRLPERAEKVILEHTSANPNGPLHVGRARNPIIGDTLVRAYRMAGYDTEAQYYVDDMGKQVAILAWARAHLDEAQVGKLIGPAARDKVDHVQVRYYQAANRLMEEDAEVGREIQALIHATETGDDAALERVEEGYADVFQGMRDSLARMDVTFDRFIKESTFVKNGDTQKVIEGLQAQTEVPVGAEGEALYLDLALKGVTGRSTRFFFRRSDGTSLYATRDVAYHLWKAGQADRLVNVLGEDHKLQATQVRVSLEMLKAPTLPQVVFYSFVSLPEGKMSTRRGRVVFLDDLLDEAVERAYVEVKKRRGDELSESEMRTIAEHVGVGAVRFTIAKVQAEKSITFKWEEALSFDGFAAPFIQYSHARVAGILDKAKAHGHLPDPDRAHLLVHDSEAALAKAIARLPVVVADAAAKHRTHGIADYAYEVAQAFNAFYRDCRVVDAETPELVSARLALVEAARSALAAAHHLLGIKALEQM